MVILITVQLPTVASEFEALGDHEVMSLIGGLMQQMLLGPVKVQLYNDCIYDYAGSRKKASEQQQNIHAK